MDALKLSHGAHSLICLSRRYNGRFQVPFCRIKSSDRLPTFTCFSCTDKVALWSGEDSEGGGQWL